MTLAAAEDIAWQFEKPFPDWLHNDHAPGQAPSQGGKWIPCTDAEGKYLDGLVQKAQEVYSKAKGGCPGGSRLPSLPPPPPVGNKNRQAC